MKCVQCSHELASGVNFCPECGAKQEIACDNCGSILNPDSRFCTECGARTKVLSVGNAGTAVGVSTIELAPLPLDLAECRISIRAVTTEGEDDSGELSVEVKYEIANETDEEWDLLECRVQLLDAAGQAVDESYETKECSIGAGGREEFETGFWGVKAKVLGTNPDKAHVVVSVIASGMTQNNLGKVTIPDDSYVVVALPPTTVGKVLQLVSGSLWKTDPNDDKEVRVEVKALVQNLTNLHLPQVRIIADVTDMAGKEIADAGCCEEVKTGGICTISGSGYGKAKKFSGANANLAIRAYWPLAGGISQSHGVAVTTGDQADDGDADEESDGTSGSDEPLSFNCRELVFSQFSYSLNEFRNLDLAAELGRWKNDVENHSIAAPLHAGSPFDSDNMNLKAAAYDAANEDCIYVIPHNFREGAEYSVISDLNSAWSIHYYPILSDLANEEGGRFPGPMKLVSLEDREELFECIAPGDGSEIRIAFFMGGTEVYECSLAESPEKIKKGLEGVLGALLLGDRLAHDAPSIDRFQAAVAKFSESAHARIEDGSIFFPPKIPEKKLRNATASFAPNIQLSDVLLLIDTTVWGSAKDGLLMTSNELFVKDLGLEPRSILLRDISSVALKQGKVTLTLVVNGEDIFQAGGVGKDAMVTFVELLQDLCK
jgi:hypothetical protein